MNKKLLLLTISAALFTSTANSVLADENVTAWRLFVSDNDKPVVNVINAGDGEKLDTFTIKGPASLYRSESGATVYAVQASANVVSVLSSGISFHDHGDHADIDVEQAKLLSSEFKGKRPGHFAERQGKVAQWFDGEQYTIVFSEESLLEGYSDAKRVFVGAAHHGIAVPYDNYAVISVPNSKYPSQGPIGSRIVGLDSKKVGDNILCPNLHGSAGSGDTYALSCETGLLLVTQKSDKPEVRHLPYPSYLPNGRVSTMIGGKGMQYFIGNYGADRIVLIDPSASQSFRIVQLPTRRVHFAIAPGNPKFAYVFTEDGKLNQIDII